MARETGFAPPQQIVTQRIGILEATRTLADPPEDPVYTDPYLVTIAGFGTGPDLIPAQDVLDIREKLLWWFHRLPGPVSELIQGQYYLAGGAFASKLLGSYINDYDLFFQNPNVLGVFVQYILEKTTEFPFRQLSTTLHPLVENNRVYLIDKTTGEEVKRQVFGPLTFTAGNTTFQVTITPNAISIGKFQIVLYTCGPPEEVTKTFDFLHCQMYAEIDGGWICKPEVILSIANQELIYTGSSTPLRSLIRLRKFAERSDNRGNHIWKPAPQTEQAILEDIRKHPITSADEVIKQLAGAYGAETTKIIRSLFSYDMALSPQLQDPYLEPYELVRIVFSGSSMPNKLRCPKRQPAERPINGY